MERSIYQHLHDAENTWWYRGRTEVAQEALRRMNSSRSFTILDFGAGYGGMGELLAQRGTVHAYEPDEESCSVARTRGYTVVHRSTEAAFAEHYDLVCLFDVLEHIEDDAQFLNQVQGALKKDGRLLITVPAMPFLWGAHDVACHHFRRYTKRVLQDLLERHGYEVEFLSYWNMFLFIPAAFARFVGKSGESSFRLPRALDAFFYGIICLEVFLMRFVSLPFGVSLVVSARKK